MSEFSQDELMTLAAALKKTIDSNECHPALVGKMMMLFTKVMGDVELGDQPGAQLSAYERATIVQALRHYYDLLFKSTGPYKEMVMGDLIALQNKVLESNPLSLPCGKPDQLDRIEAMLVAMKGGGV